MAIKPSVLTILNTLNIATTANMAILGVDQMQDVIVGKAHILYSPEKEAWVGPVIDHTPAESSNPHKYAKVRAENNQRHIERLIYTQAGAVRMANKTNNLIEKMEREYGC